MFLTIQLEINIKRESTIWAVITKYTVSWHTVSFVLRNKVFAVDLTGLKNVSLCNMYILYSLLC